MEKQKKIARFNIFVSFCVWKREYVSTTPNQMGGKQNLTGVFFLKKKKKTYTQFKKHSKKNKEEKSKNIFLVLRWTQT